MRSDPLEAYRKYWPIKSAAEKAGLAATISVPQEQPDGIKISNRDGEHVLSFFRRPSGAFILVPGTKLGVVPRRPPWQFLVPHLLGTTRLIQILLTLARMQSAEDRVRCCAEEHGWPATTPGQLPPEFEERFRACRAYGWERLSKQEEDDAYAAVERLVGRDWNSLDSLPHMAWNCAAAEGLRSNGDFEILETDLTMGMLAAFRESLPRGRTFEVIDPNHSCFRFDPHAGIRSAHRDQWAKPIYPLDDSYCYFEREMKMGVLCRVQTKEIVVFGARLIEAVLANPPILFTGEPSRRGGIV